MSEIPRRKIVRSLKKKGFVETKDKGDHDWFVFRHGDREYKQIMAKISRGSDYKDYPESLWKRMKERLGLDSLGDVADLLNCPMDHDAYVDMLKRKRIIAK